MTLRESGAPQESMKEVLDLVTEKLYGASRMPKVVNKQCDKF